MYVCNGCSESFKYKQSFRRHLRDYPGPHSFPCDKCKKTFKRLAFLKNHFCLAKFQDPVGWDDNSQIEMKNEILEQPIFVEVKKELESFSSSDDEPLIQFVEQNDLNLENQCQECGWLFTTKAFLNRHKSIYKEQHFMYPCCETSIQKDDNVLKHICCQETSKVKNELGLSLSEVDENDNGFGSDHQEDNSDVQESYSSESEADKRPYTCYNCPKSFFRKDSLKKHLKNYPGKHHFRCKKCGASFIQEDKLLKHQCILAGGKKFKCSCKQAFTSVKKFRKHVGGQRPFKCCSCSMIHVTLNNLVIHIRTHTHEKPYSCSVCPKNFKTQVSLKLHNKIHANERAYKCSKCSHSSNIRWSLILHERTHDKSFKQEKNLLCNECGAAYSLKSQLRRHVINHSDEKRHLCKFCGKLFKHDDYLRRHLEVHETRSDLGRKCRKCGEEFPRSEMYAHHLRTGHYEFICNPCEKVFCRKLNFLQHLRRHDEPTFSRGKKRSDRRAPGTPGKVHGCEQCDKTYSRPSALRAHYLRKHNTVVAIGRPYVFRSRSLDEMAAHGAPPGQDGNMSWMPVGGSK